MNDPSNTLARPLFMAPRTRDFPAPRDQRPIHRRVETMLNPACRSFWLIGSWLAALMAIVAASIAMRANLSTTALLFGCGIAPAVVVGLLAYAEPSPTVAQILHSVDTKDGRS